jgi:molecular chaperone HscB
MTTDSEKPDYFTFYGFIPTVDLDLKELKKRYLQKSIQYHPDQVSAVKGENADECLRMAALNNDAYRTLKSFDSRVQHYVFILARAQPFNKKSLPSDFLMEMMELNESLEEAISTHRQEQKSTLARDLQQKKEEIKHAIVQLSQLHPPSPADIQLELEKLTYISQLLHRF